MAVAKQSKLNNKEHKRNVADSSDNTAAKLGRHSQTAESAQQSQQSMTAWQPDSEPEKNSEADSTASYQPY